MQIREPALRAWYSLGHAPPERAELLRRREKSVVYRLYGAGHGGTDVIAKQCLWEIALDERAVYEVLARLPELHLDYYGFVAEPERGFGWLFIEDARGEPYSPDDPAHRILAARWLATLHTSSWRAAVGSKLPERGPPHYLELLREGRRRILDGLGSPWLAPEDQEVLRRILAVFDLVEARWREVQSRCDAMPRALAHGDFADRNVRIRLDGERPSVFAFDWEMAGWGLPAVDLSCVDLTAYRDGVRGAWNLDLATVREAATLGELLRGGIAAVSWLSWSLGPRSRERVTTTMPIYLARLRHALEGLGWPHG